MLLEYKSLIRNTNFLCVWASQLLSQLTINIMNFLLLVRLFAITGSAIATSLLWVAYALPAILIGPFAAATVDLIDRRKMLMVTNLLQASVVLSYALVHETKFFLLYGVAFCYSFLNQFYLPAESATLPSVVEKNFLPYANGLFFITQQGALIIGFGIAGILNQFFGYSNSLFLAAALLFLAFIAVSFLPPLKIERELPHTYQEAVEHFFTTIVQGYQFIKENKVVLAPFLLLLALQVVLAMVAVNIPILATELFQISPNSAGVLIIVPAGIGAIAGAIFIPRILRGEVRKKTIIDYGLMALGFLLLGLGFLVPELNEPLRMIVGFILIIFTGLAFVSLLIPAQTFLQEKTPGGLRGRVFGNFWFLTTIATLMPVIFSGALTELLGIHSLLLLLSGLSLSALVVSKRQGQRFIEKVEEIETKQI